MSDLVVLMKVKDLTIQSLREKLCKQSGELLDLREMQERVLKAEQYLIDHVVALDRMHSDKKIDASLRNHAFVIKKHLDDLVRILGVDIEN